VSGRISLKFLLLLLLLLPLLLLVLLPPYHPALSYMQAGALKAAGVDKVLAVTVGDPKEVQQWAAAHGFDKANMVGGTR
jgi:hypothetical protein